MHDYSFSSHRAWTIILQSWRLPFNLCTSSEKIYFRDVFFLFLPDSPSTVLSWFDAFFARNMFHPSIKRGNPRPTCPAHLRHRICLKYSHCHHRNHLYNLHQEPILRVTNQKVLLQGLASNLEVTLMTETKFLHLQRR